MAARRCALEPQSQVSSRGQNAPYGLVHAQASGAPAVPQVASKCCIEDNDGYIRRAVRTHVLEALLQAKQGGLWTRIGIERGQHSPLGWQLALPDYDQCLPRSVRYRAEPPRRL
jgi:hypothetical protein